jgi:hypothetical protein
MASNSGSPALEDEHYNTYVGRIARDAWISLSGQGIRIYAAMIRLDGKQAG